MAEFLLNYYDLAYAVLRFLGGYTDLGYMLVNFFIFVFLQPGLILLFLYLWLTEKKKNREQG